VARILAGASAVTVVSASLALAHAGAASASPSTLMYSLKSDRSNAQALYGATIPQNAYVFTPTASGVKSVRFIVDGKVIRDELTPGYDLAGTFDNGLAGVYTFSAGTHTVQDTVTYTNGVQSTQTATIKVVAPTTTGSTAAPAPTTTAPPVTTKATTPATTAAPAPATTTAPQTSGWTKQQVLTKPFNSSSYFNRPIAAGTTFTRTSSFAGDPGWVNDEQSSLPVFFGSTSDPLTTVTLQNNPSGIRSVKLHVPANAQPAPGSDSLILIVDLTTGDSWDLWNATRTGSTSFTAALGIKTNLAGTGFGNPSGPVKAGTRASGASSLGGLITGENLKAGKIDHALAIAADNGNLMAKIVYPAVTGDNGWQTAYKGSLPMGTHLGIPKSTAKPAGLSSIGSMVFDAFQNYGGYLLDRTGGFAIFAEPNTVSPSQVDPLRAYWNSGGSDLQKIIPLLQVVHD
jgi:hypothetical protein